MIKSKTDCRSTYFRRPWQAATAGAGALVNIHSCGNLEWDAGEIENQPRENNLIDFKLTENTMDLNNVLSRQVEFAT